MRQLSLLDLTPAKCAGCGEAIPDRYVAGRGLHYCSLACRPASRPYVASSETSREAAESIEPSAGTFRAMVLSYLRIRGDEGATDEEIQGALSLNPSTQRPRRVELVQRRLVVDSGRTRPTRSGRRATVWVAK